MCVLLLAREAATERVFFFLLAQSRHTSMANWLFVCCCLFLINTSNPTQILTALGSVYILSLPVCLYSPRPMPPKSAMREASSPLMQLSLELILASTLIFTGF